MSMMLARRALRASSSSLLPAARAFSSSSPARLPTPEEEKAAQLINKLPSSPGIITKTGTAVLATSLGAAAISQELYVVNEETILLVGTAILLTYLGKAVSGPYSSWASSQVAKVQGILAAARQEHTASVTQRIDSVSQMKDVSALTASLFVVAKETAKLESETFEQKQKVEVTKQLKDVLDSWVRYEQSVREAEQGDLTKTVIGNVMKALSETKTQKDILTEAVAEVERMVKAKAV